MSSSTGKKKTKNRQSFFATIKQKAKCTRRVPPNRDPQARPLPLSGLSKKVTN